LSRSTIPAPSDAGAIASLKRTVGVVPVAMPVEPAGGVTELTRGGVRSAFVVSKVTSTQEVHAFRPAVGKPPPEA
jgi:hypothetical protein